MRGFLWVTAHFMEINKSRLQAVQLSCDRFTGSHTGQRINDAFEEICAYFYIKHKIDYIICDNASNMKKAFTVCFPSENDDEGLENSNLWEDLSEEYQDDKETIRSSCQQQWLQCFAHSLQLVMRDALKETKVLSSAITKVTKFYSLLHSTSGLKEAFDRVWSQPQYPLSSINAMEQYSPPCGVSH